MKFTRLLDLPALLEKKSHFLFGPRATGKSYLIRESFGSSVPVINLLRQEQFMRLSHSPYELEAMLMLEDVPKMAVIDEFQLIPELLNEVHRLIEERSIHFLLTGSSARKLKRKNVNLLAGRARKAEIFPLTTQEITKFDLMRYLHVGGGCQLFTLMMSLKRNCLLILKLICVMRFKLSP